MLPKVSVVVPIYKVEKYLKRCVESIVNQTYVNLEIILVDDGSPDRCGQMVDHYAKLDHRVIALHKINGGLSDARNYGMKYVTGEYTLFVDSDDWLELGLVEELMNHSLQYKADIVQSAFFYAHDTHLIYDNRYYSKDSPPVVLDNPSLMAELVINERVKNFAWGKLYKTDTIRDIPFEKGVLFEDVFWAHQIMHRAQTYVIVHQPMYFYYQRCDSIVAIYTPRNLDILRGLKKRHAFIENYYKNLICESYKGILKTSLIHYNLLLANRKKDKNARYRKEIQRYIKENHDEFEKAVHDDRELKRQLFLFTIHPFLNIMYLLFNRSLRRLNITQQPFVLQRFELEEEGG